MPRSPAPHHDQLLRPRHLNQTGAVALVALLNGGVEAAVAAPCARYATAA
ncbi:hypothetical protein [Actinophytocola sp.]|nr:hypothetical protein [Actinophytocola sp.]